jgi:iron complex transport system ATP-binding protein
VEEPVVDLHRASVQRGPATLLDAVTLQIHAAERWIVLGPNGAGKTTLLNLLAARSHPSRGFVTVLGETLGDVDVFDLRPRIGLASAAVADDLPPQETALDVVRTAAYARIGRWRERYDAGDDDRAHALLEMLGAGQLAERRFGTLSEGERKRVQIARALMPDPELLLLDEPAAGLDLGAREDLVQRLGRLARDPASPTIVMVTHHVEEIPDGFTHGLLLSHGRVVAAGELRAVVTAEMLSAAFGLPLAVTHWAGRFTARAAPGR